MFCRDFSCQRFYLGVFAPLMLNVALTPQRKHDAEWDFPFVFPGLHEYGKYTCPCYALLLCFGVMMVHCFLYSWLFFKKKKLILLLFAILWNRFFKMWSMWRVLISSNVSDSFLSFKSVILQEILKGCDGLSWKCLTYIDLLINTCVKICVTQHICTQVDLRGNCFSHRICWKSFGQILLNVQLISRLRQGLLFFHNFPPKGSSLLNNSLFLL